MADHGICNNFLPQTEVRNSDNASMSSQSRLLNCFQSLFVPVGSFLNAATVKLMVYTQSTYKNQTLLKQPMCSVI